METHESSRWKEMLTAQEFFQDVLRVSEGVGYSALNQGQFPFVVRIGRQWRIPRDAMLAWLAQSEAAGASWQGQPAAHTDESKEAHFGR